jgi:hypothetical protein
MKTDHVRVSGFFSFVNLEYRLNLSAHVTILLTSCDTGNKENVGGVNMIVCMFFSYWISNLGNHHYRWVGVDNVHIPCKYIILANLICFYCYLVDRYGKYMSQMTDIFLIHLS